MASRRHPLPLGEQEQAVVALQLPHLLQELLMH